MNTYYVFSRTLCALTLTAFALQSAPSKAQEGSTITQPLVASKDARFWTQNGNAIPMCWHELLQFPSTQAANDAKAFVIRTIQDGWISQLNLRITWVDCPTSGEALHVRVKLRIGDGGNNGTTLQSGMNTLSTAAQRVVQPPNDPPGLLMGFRSDWNTSDAARASFRGLILHEFGHVLGFDHEHQRPDGPQDIGCYRDIRTDAVLIGPADPKSIMSWSYCKESSLNVLTLSDIRGARSVYGRQDISIRGVILAGKFRTQHELNTMSRNDQRNILIVELAGRSKQSGAFYQALNDEQLAGTGSVLVFLREAKIRTDQELKTMTADDQRNTMIVEMGGQTGLGSVLQGLSNLDLALIGLGKTGPGGLPSDLGRGLYIRGVLLAGKFRGQGDLNRMSSEDQRNTLIVELAGRTNQPVGHYQSLNDATLVGTGAILVFLRESRIRSDKQLKTMSDDDMRNTMIVEVGRQTGLDAQLQGLNNLELVHMAFGIFP
ncbi:MAG: hypothetical protein OEV27_02580 [Nitrospira sp.]|nr:hypothetical protein [Nitrospira sp.]MDH4342044.1 hypothetical protein [Nitrospira sp.]MDH5335379.1 hypothetical protein [Nitrospira sp.]